MDPRDLIRLGLRLASGAVGGRRGRPRQTELRRAISAAYYAMFHTLAACCANQLAGATPASRNQAAWRQIYRALEHGYARAQCERAISGKFPAGIRDFARQFVSMQFERQNADYDPDERYLRLDVMENIQETERIISQFNHASKAEQRAFAIHVLHRSR